MSLKSYRPIRMKQELPSTTSSTVPVCFVCGNESIRLYPLYSKPWDGGPFFPFLEHHQCPQGASPISSNGIAMACMVCYSFLTQQWESYEKSRTSHDRRLYWLKRCDNGPFAGIEFGVQSEYASQVLGIPQSGSTESARQISYRFCSMVDEVSQPDHMEKIESRDSNCSGFSNHVERSQPTLEDSEALDLSVSNRTSFLESPSACVEVCYVCAGTFPKGTLVNVYAKPIANCPFFPSLAIHPKPSKAKSMDSSGRVKTCESCHRSLLCQWDAYQQQNIPHAERSYYITGKENRLTSIDKNNHCSKILHEEPGFVCFTCGMELPFSLQRDIYAYPQPEKGPYFKFLRRLKPNPGSVPMSSHGKVVVCAYCQKFFLEQYQNFEISCTPEEKRVYRLPRENSCKTSFLQQNCNPVQQEMISGSFGCYLCKKPTAINQLFMVSSRPENGTMFFPFLKDLPKPANAKPMDYYGQVLTCLDCHGILQNQWEAFEMANIPHHQRQYFLHTTKSANFDHTGISGKLSCPETSLSPHSSNSALHIQISSPDMQIDTGRNIKNHEPLLTTVSTLLTNSVHNTQVNLPASSRVSAGNQDSNLVATATARINSLKVNIEDQDGNRPSRCQDFRIDCPFSASLNKMPLMVSTVCFVCGEKSLPGHTFPLGAIPNRNESPFFPFLLKHPSPIGSQPLTDYGSCLVCTFCYHSLMAQWFAYEASPYAEDGYPWDRKYNTHHYVCFICGTTTYRQRVRTIFVRDFPFLIDHPRPPGALSLANGRSVVTCLTCYEFLMSQWKDFERMKVPVELRKYNWIVMPPPPESDAARINQCLSVSSPSPGIRWSVSVSESCDTERTQNLTNALIHQGLPHGSRSLSGTIQPSSSGPQRAGNQNLQTSSPVDYSSSHGSSVIVSYGTASNNPALKATRTSSFAAALRKLAKQAVDPITETTASPVSPVSTPLPAHRSTTPKQHILISSQSSMPLVHPLAVSVSPTLSYATHTTESRNKDTELSRHLQGGTTTSLMEPLSLKIDKSTSRTTNSGYYGSVKREELYHGSSDIIRHPSSSLQRTETGRESEESHVSSSGFHIYRNVEGVRSSIPAHIPSYEHPMSYPYQATFLPPPPPSFSHHTYRHEDAMYLDHYGLLKTPTSHLPTSSGTLNLPGLPCVTGNPYPPELLGQSVRVASPSSSVTARERTKFEEERVQECSRNSSRETYSHFVQNPLSVTLARNSESPGRPGSITHGTPREQSSKHSSPPVTSFSVPLNLVRSNNQNSNKWVPHYRISHQQNKSQQEGLGFHHSLLLQQDLKQHLAVTGRKVAANEMELIAREKNDIVKHSIPQRKQGSNSPTVDGLHRQHSPLPNSSHLIHSDRLTVKPSLYSTRYDSPDRLTLLNQERKSVISADTSGRSPSELTKTELLSPKLVAHHISNFHNSISKPEATPEHISTTLIIEDKHHSVSTVEATCRDSTQQAAHFPEKMTTDCTSGLPKVISKLDLEWEKLQKARLAGKCGVSDDELDTEDEDEENHLREILIITKGPPLNLDLSPKKLEFLRIFGLISHQKRQKLEFEKYIRSRKVLEEQQFFPHDTNNTNKDCSTLLPMTTKINSEELCLVPDFPQRVQFLQFLGLQPTTLQEKIEVEQNWKVTEEDRVCRKRKVKTKHIKKIKLADIKPHSSESLPLQMKKQRLESSPSRPNGALSVEEYNPPVKVAAIVQSQLSSSKPNITEMLTKYDTPGVSAIPHHHHPTVGQKGDSKDRRVVIISDPTQSDKKTKKLAKDFVHEFHKSVLETTQQQLAEQSRHWSAESRTEVTPSPTTCSSEKVENYHWPGIEIVMEAYEFYLKEQKQEQEFLMERCQYLKRKNQDASLDAERLCYRMTELLKLKQRLDEERHRHQVSVDNLKRFLQLMR
ncbi:uncharacterized protein LOC143248890 isoform X2 [Tachypleus tridentatus]|uniref:uncharacterized protein LOC143248890 isoform X2 n=1 Tax=Tachypleus tridentatus TaxID=6853 RepID=UPI003FCEEFAF